MWDRLSDLMLTCRNVRYGVTQILDLVENLWNANLEPTELQIEDKYYIGDDIEILNNILDNLISYQKDLEMDLFSFKVCLKDAINVLSKKVD